MRTKFMWLGLALVAAGGTGAVWQVRVHTAATDRARGVAEWQMAQLRAERETLEARLAQWAGMRAATEELTRLDAGNPKATTKAAMSAVGAGAREERRSSKPKRADVWERSIRREPELQALRLAADRAQRALDFEGFFRTRGLTVEQIGRFQEIASAHAEATADIDAAVASQNLAEDDPSVERLRQAARAENDAKLRALLGADGLQQFREFEKTLALRSAVRGFAAVALEAGVPLSAAQAEQLVEALVRSRGAATERKVPNWDAVDEAARGFLRPDQLSLLQHVEPNVHGAGGRRWLALHERVEAARAEDERIVRKF